MRLTLLAILLLAFLLGVMQLGFATHIPDNWWGITVFTVDFWIWMSAGVAAWWRRPNNTMGGLIVFGGIVLFLGGLGNLGDPIFSVVGFMFSTTILAVTVHMLHAFPSGHVRGRFSQLVVVLAYVVGFAFQAPRPFISDAAVSAALGNSQRALGVGVMILTAVILVQRVRNADRAHRRLLTPLFIYGSCAVLLIPGAPPLLSALGADFLVTASVQIGLIAGVPIAFLIGVLLGGFTSTIELETLSVWLGLTGAPRATVARAMASTLGDDSLRIVYWSAGRNCFVDDSGAPVDISHEDDTRGTFNVYVQSRLVGAIVYDNRIIGGTGQIRRASEVLALAVDRERLTAELRASNDALVLSRKRLVETSDRERNRIAQDLHDGLQVQLVLLALDAQQIGWLPRATSQITDASTELRERIDRAASDLRRFVHDILPSALVERGLSMALDDLIDRLGMQVTLDAQFDDDRLAPATTHTAYFIIAEALTNAVKHSGATSIGLTIHQDGDRLSIRIEDNGVGGASLNGGTGLQGLAERVDVLGGSFALESAPQNGTTLLVELPYGLGPAPRSHSDATESPLSST